MTILNGRLPIGLSAALILGLTVAGCGGGSSSSSPTPLPTGTPPPAILVNGATYQYTGSETVAITYTNPTSTNVNSNAAYTYTAAQTVSNAAAGAAAAFDVNRVTTYTVTQAPASGELLQSNTNDTYENQTFNGATETITTAATKGVTTGIDLNAGLRLGSGPFNETNTTTTNFVAPQLDETYPLVTGAVVTPALARNTVAVVSDTNGAGTYGGGGTTTTNFNGDGSFTRTFQATDGSSSQQASVIANGTATNSVTNNTSGSVTLTSVGTPVGSGSAATIPVTITTNGNAVTDNAVDWYPGGIVAAPLAITTRTIKGPASLPAACNFSGSAPSVVEIDSTSPDLSPLGSYSTTTGQTFNANGIEICRLQTATTMNYALATGLPTSVTTTTTVESLQSSNQTIAGLKRRTP